MKKNSSSPNHAFSKSLLLPAIGILLAVTFSSCASRSASRTKDRAHVVEISVPEQRMAVYREGKPVKYYPVSTSKFGLGDTPGSNKTPLGKFEIAQKIGDGKRSGTVFKSRKPTGEVVKPNSPGRDPIVSRILWLEGQEKSNKNAYGRYIYIHGTPEERTIGTPASYGCIRMKSKDVINLYNTIGHRADVYVVNKPLWKPDPKAPATEPAKSKKLPAASMTLAAAKPKTKAAPKPAKPSSPQLEQPTLNPHPPSIPTISEPSEVAVASNRSRRHFEPLLAGNHSEE